MQLDVLAMLISKWIHTILSSLHTVMADVKLTIKRTLWTIDYVYMNTKILRKLFMQRHYFDFGVNMSC